MGRHKETTYQTCTVCAREFYKPPSHLAKWPNPTCSRSCAAVLRRKTTITTCKTCGKQFEVRKKVLTDNNGKYCSSACNGIADRRRLTVACSRCGVDFDIVRYRATRRLHFCCIECKLDFHKAFNVHPTSEKFWGKKNAHLLGTSCGRCGSTERLELDHIVPRFAGGKASADNVQTLCKKCNSRKFWHEDLPKYLTVKRIADH